MGSIDYHALLPEIILAVTVLVTLGVDLITKKKAYAAIAAIVGLFAATIPVLTLAFCDSLELDSCQPGQSQGTELIEKGCRINSTGFSILTTVLKL